MSRRANAKPAGIQMFPFLAVLICTMGALVVLLHAFARHGQAQARQIAEAEAKARQWNVDDFQWRIRHLRAARDKTEAELTDERLKLAHVEDHQRRLEEKLRQLERAVAEMERATAQNIEQKHATADELEAAKAELEEVRVAVDAARRQGRQRRVSYSIVPYESRNTTHRRPIYIECRENLIVLQPEGVELSPRDFAGSFAPGNPLAAALRAQGEYFARQAPDGKPAAQPYPLMLVRPEGVASYYAARAALDSWGSEFGYELIGSDWLLKFPDPDPQLAALTRKVVSEARQRHREYIDLSPSLARTRSRPVYRARAHGGFAPVGEPGAALHDGGKGNWDDFAGDWARGDAGPDNRRYGSTDGDFSRGPDAALEDPYGDAGSGFGDAGSDAESRSATTDRTSERAGGGRASSQSRGGLLAQDADNPSGTNPTFAGSSANNRSGPGDSGVGSEPSALAPGNASGELQTRGDQAASSSGQAGGTTSSQGSHSHPSSQAATTSTHKPQSISSIRGDNWGLPESGPGAVAATRPILIDAHPDRLVILPESRGQRPTEIRLQSDTRDSIDELVSAVWEHMRAWGKAGRGLYWRPMLSIDVKPGGAGRYAEIEALLADSGLDVEQRRPVAPRQSTTGRTDPGARPPDRP